MNGPTSSRSNVRSVRHHGVTPHLNEARTPRLVVWYTLVGHRIASVACPPPDLSFHHAPPRHRERGANAPLRCGASFTLQCGQTPDPRKTRRPPSDGVALLPDGLEPPHRRGCPAARRASSPPPRGVFCCSPASLPRRTPGLMLFARVATLSDPGLTTSELVFSPSDAGRHAVVTESVPVGGKENTGRSGPTRALDPPRVLRAAPHVWRLRTSPGTC